MNSVRKQGIQIGTQQGDKQRQVKVVRRMLKAKKYSHEEIAEITEVDIDAVKRTPENSD